MPVGPTVKVLDFGLAKAFQPDASNPNVSVSPTISLTAAATELGMIVGTAAYMAPEQASGKVVDKRADVWAFGVVLYEMLTGQRLFSGEDVSHTLAFILTKDVDWSALPTHVPDTLRRVLRRCLERDPRQRMRDIGDARLEILEIDEPTDEAPSSVPDKRRPAPWAAIVGTAVVSATVVGAGMLALRPPSTAPGPATRFTIRTQSEEPLGQAAPLAISPDGRQVVYEAGGLGTRLFLHDLEGFEARVLEDSEAPQRPFFSADGAQVGFNSAAGLLRALPVAGGATTSLGGVDVVNMGASWDVDGTLVLSSSWGRPLRILRPGSEIVELTRVDTEDGEGSHVWPQILPGGQDALFTIWTGASWDEARIAAVDLDTGDHRIVWRGGTFGRYVASGHLLFWRANALWAASFDATTATVTGEPVRVIDGVRLANGQGAAHFAVSETGTLVYVPGRQDSFAESYITDRSGQVLLRLDRDTAVGDPVFSPEGRRVALTVYNQGTYDVAVFDLERQFLTRIASGRDNLRPSWTPDGRRVSSSLTPTAITTTTRPVRRKRLARPALLGEPRRVLLLCGVVTGRRAPGLHEHSHGSRCLDPVTGSGARAVDRRPG